MSRTAQFRWPDAVEATAKSLYVEQGLGPNEVAEQLGEGYDARMVSRLAINRGWSAQRDPEVTKAARARALRKVFDDGIERDGEFLWTRERKALLRQRYVEDLKTAAEIAKELGDGVTPRAVSGKIVRMGLAAQRPGHASPHARTSATAPSPKSTTKSASKASPVFALGEGRGLPADVRAAIDAAIAAGKVTVLPSGRAAGLSVLEAQFGAARPEAAGTMRDRIKRTHDIAMARRNQRRAG